MARPNAGTGVGGERISARVFGQKSENSDLVTLWKEFLGLVPPTTESRLPFRVASHPHSQECQRDFMHYDIYAYNGK